MRKPTVLGYKEGKGKFSKMVGSLKVQGDDGIVFFVGITTCHNYASYHPL